MQVLITLVVAVSAVWVYLDATKHKIGKRPGASGLLNLSAGGWAASTLFLWIIGFPAYLIKRKSLIALASDMPVTVSRRGVKTGVLAAIGGLWVLAALAAEVPATAQTAGDAQAAVAESGETAPAEVEKVASVQPEAAKPKHNWLVESDGKYGYGSAVSKNQAADGQVAGDVNMFRYVGKQGDKYQIVDIGTSENEGATVVLECTYPCTLGKVMGFNPGSIGQPALQTEYTQISEATVASNIFEDAANGALTIRMTMDSKGQQKHIWFDEKKGMQLLSE
ncbi:hypothetical protein R0381_003600 [Jeongeupia wiesaeckerbachi]|uniref:hypothetical protein n=1 Tax=Jeongeupia wiesaeckerbachi TaxID=3051218 RepID=UPI003D8075E9